MGRRKKSVHGLYLFVLCGKRSTAVSKGLSLLLYCLQITYGSPDPWSPLFTVTWVWRKGLKKGRKICGSWSWEQGCHVPALLPVRAGFPWARRVVFVLAAKRSCEKCGQGKRWLADVNLLIPLYEKTSGSHVVWGSGRLMLPDFSHVSSLAEASMRTPIPLT